MYTGAPFRKWQDTLIPKRMDTRNSDGPSRAGRSILTAGHACPFIRADSRDGGEADLETRAGADPLIRGRGGSVENRRVVAKCVQLAESAC